MLRVQLSISSVIGDSASVPAIRAPTKRDPDIHRSWLANIFPRDGEIVLYLHRSIENDLLFSCFKAYIVSEAAQVQSLFSIF
jgi:hypothetical protein